MSDSPQPTSSASNAGLGEPGNQPVPEVLIRSLEFLVGWRNEALTAMPAPPKSLYHYTDAPALVSISSGQQLWATNAVFMNDQTEVSHAAALLQALLVVDQHNTGLVENLGPDLAVQHLLSFVHNFVEIYVVSFCAEPDLLSQWRGYGKAAGYAIEFDGPSLLDLGPGNVVLAQVIYEEDVQRRRLSELLTSWRSALAGVECSESDWFKAAALLAQAFGVLAISFKDKAFAEEKEWRLFYSRLRLPQTLPDEYFSVLFRARDGLVVPYVTFTPRPSNAASERSLLPINSIRVGPRPYPPLAASGVWHLINEQKLGDHVVVTNSATPLRL
jgi:hypothetical protein